MELRQYAGILWKRAWIIVAVTLLAGAIGYLASPAREGFVADLTVAIGVRPEQKQSDIYQYDRYYSFLSSEYLADDFSEVIKSQAFLNDVKQALGGADIPLDSIFGNRSITKTHRLLAISVSARTQDMAQRIADAVVNVMQAKGNLYLAQLGSDQALVTVIDPPRVYPASHGSKALLDLGLRTGLGLLAGLALVLLLEYLDTTVRDRTEAEGLLGLAVLGELPPE
ncbi:MAG: Wzz/FepE/Etk N-terminal domain-containing protein [Dehalococcoidia bacterium]|nr:Wzz/FepE/Etk N-terminal domain-containing protein [Dehalococcoidia bacterium]